MKQKQSYIIVTEDNSKTLLIPELNETYHSTKGALTESLHVFIKKGLIHYGQNSVKIFEMGFGTGLNALLTLKEAINRNIKVEYYTIESAPLNADTVLDMEYVNKTDSQHLSSDYEKMLKSKHEEQIILNEHFTFIKYIGRIQEFEMPNETFDIIYYDAFGPKVQPELWLKPVLSKFYNGMKSGACLVTYCAQGQFKRELKALNFTVQEIPGPPGKREMTRALKE